MAVAGGVPALAPLPMPVVPAAPQALPPTYQPGPLLQQASFPSASFFQPSSFSQPQAPPQPRLQHRQKHPKPWRKSKRGQQQPATGLPDFDKLRRNNSKLTQQAFGNAPSGLAGRPDRQRFNPPPPRPPRQAGGMLGVQQTKFKRPAWNSGRRSRQQPGASSRRQRFLQARAQTPATIIRTPATIQHTPSTLQQIHGAPASAHANGTPTMMLPRRRRRDSHDPDTTLLGAGLDFFGTNQGLILRRSASLSSSAGSDADDSGSDSEPGNEYELRLRSTSAASLPQHVQAHIDDQAQQIAQLEIDNTRLSDENINLKERLFVMEKEMAELRHAGTASTEEDAPQQWFGMAESDGDDVPVGCPSKVARSSAAIVEAQQQSAVAAPDASHASPSSHSPITIDMQ